VLELSQRSSSKCSKEGNNVFSEDKEVSCNIADKMTFQIKSISKTNGKKRIRKKKLNGLKSLSQNTSSTELHQMRVDLKKS